MKIGLKHIACGALTAVLLTFYGMLGGCVHREDSRKLCDRLDVQFKDKLEFVTEEDVRGFLDRKYGVYIGVRLDSLDLDRMERMLEEKSVVLNSEAWTTRDGVLHVSIEQRAPVLRFQRGDKGFYVDKTGYVFPLHKSFTADVPVIEGAIPPIEDGSRPEWTAGMLQLMEYARTSRVWKDRIEKISVNGAGEVEIKMSGSPERFILGFPDELDGKFGRIAKYYSHILPSVSEGYYKSVNLKYNKQIICRKDI